MLSRKTIEAYLFFLLRHRLAVSLMVACITLILGGFMWTRMHIFTNFFDLYPPDHPYIKLYTQYRSMFGTANTLLLVVEVKDGTIFDDIETVQKVDRITLALLHDIPGVNGDQVLSITHPKLKTTLTAGSGIKVVPLMYPRVPENKEDLDFLKLQAYTTEGVKGPFVSEDDKATLIVAGFWEEYFDLPTMWTKIQEIVRQESDANTKFSVTGPPIPYAYFPAEGRKMAAVLAASIVMILLILWLEFRSWQGVVIPAFSGTLSAIWGLGFGGLCNWTSQYVPWIPALSLDPLVLVIPLLISARAHSHSVQSMERYHEEYHRLRDRDQAIVKSYAEIYAPAMVSILADGLAILTLLVARIPIIQKLAILCSFWIISIFISVVTLHPIILSFTPPPAEEHVSGRTPLERFMSWMMVVAIAWLLWLYEWIPGWPVTAMLGLTLGGLASDLLLGIALPGYGDVGFALSRATDAFGAVFGRLYLAIEHGLIWLASGRRRPAMAVGLVSLLSFGLYFQHLLKVGDTTPGAALLYPKHPYNVAFGKVNEKFLGASQLVIIAEGNAYCTVKGAPCEGPDCQRCFPEQEGQCEAEKCVQREGAIKNAATLSELDLFARYMAERPEVGGTVAVTEEVEWSYRVNLALILAVVFALSYATYVSFLGALIVMLPSLVAQPLSEAVMYLFGIDMNINSLPVAAVGIGIGIDYGYYVLSRIVEELCAGEGFDVAIRRMFETTGKTVLFTGVSLTASIIFWVFFPMKFQADMALLLVLLLGFHLMGALMFIPPMVSLFKPRFAIKYAEERQRIRAEAAAAEEARVARVGAAGG